MHRTPKNGPFEIYSWEQAALATLVERSGMRNA
jgi:hypothetical protein